MSRRAEKKGESGFTIVELSLAVGLSLLVMLGLGRVIVMNVSAWNASINAMRVQQNAEFVLSWLSRDIQGAWSLQVVSAGEIRTYDQQDVLLQTYKLVTVAEGDRIQRNGANMAPEECNLFTVTANPDTTLLTLTITLKNSGGTSVTTVAQASPRNDNWWFL